MTLTSRSRAGGWRGLLVGLLLIVAAPALADWRQQVPGARQIGGGDFTWFGLRVYTARSWSPVAPLTWQQPFALELTYHRPLSRETLVQASVDEMQRLGGTEVDAAALQGWADEMRDAFVDVQPGQRITGVHLPGVGCRFYVDGRFQHEVNDTAFARAFFSIWLDARARHSQLRRQLAGLAETSE